MVGYSTRGDNITARLNRIRKTKDVVVGLQRDKDRDFYRQKIDHENDVLSCFRIANLEYKARYESEIRDIIRQNPELSYVFSGNDARLLHPENYWILKSPMCPLRPYRAGKGSQAKVFMAQDCNTNEVVVMKIFNDHNCAAEKIIKECGYFHKGQQVLAAMEGYEPAHFRGFLRIEGGSRMERKVNPLVTVTSLAGLVKNAPISLPLGTALSENDSLDITDRDWADIAYYIMNAAIVLNKGDVLHNDYNRKNICIGYHDGEFKITVIDFGNSKLVSHSTDIKERYSDVFEAATLVRSIATAIDFRETGEYARDIKDDWEREYDRNHRDTMDFSYILGQLDGKLKQDLR